MPPVFLAIAAFAILHTALFISLVMFGASIVIGEISKMFAKSASSSSLSHTVSTRTITTRQAISPFRVIYGANRVGGIITFLHTTGASNEFLQMVITLAGHELSSIGTMYFDGVAVPVDGSGNATGNFAGFVHVEKNLGTRGQAAFAGLVAAAPTYWTSAHRQRGRAGVYTQLKWDVNKFPNGVPNITFDVNGRKVYDPRTGAISFASNCALNTADAGDSR